MHELSIMANALETALNEARQAGAKRICTLTLRIGDLSGVVPEALELAFGTLSFGTLAEGGKLCLERVPARFWCSACNSEFAAGSSFALCPACGEPCPDLRSGRELEITSLEIE
jgi:hydrogenase nickel incorporation protein HypA/HybF